MNDEREDFINVAEETLDSLPEEFCSRIQNVAILVGDFPLCRDYAAELGSRSILSSGARYGASDGITFGTRF